MYDVVRRKVVKGKEILYCIADKKEKSLVDNYNAITKKNSSSDKKEKNSIDNSFDLFCYDEMFSHHYAAMPIKQSAFYHSYLPESIATKIFCPPKA
jgi:hypothetical protein